MIHEIIVDGFKDEIVSLKSKIRMKMLNIGYMRSDFNYIENFDEFWGNYKSYNVFNIDKKEFINVIYSNRSNPNPIAYLTLIIYLFGSLKSYYEYEIDGPDLKTISQKSTKIVSLTKSLKPSGLRYYNDLIYEIYEDRYSIVKKTDKKHYKIKCNLCYREWVVPQYYIKRGMICCTKCLNKKMC
jgi:hypothetical protein